MPKKTPSSLNMHDLLQALQAYMDEDGAWERAQENALPDRHFLSIDQTRSGGSRRGLAVTQFYLKCHGAPDEATLEVLPGEMFIVC